MNKARDWNPIRKKGRFLGGCHRFLIGRQSAPGIFFSRIPANDAIQVKAGIFKEAQDLSQIPIQGPLPEGVEQF
jgi:hypothetical protein